MSPCIIATLIDLLLMLSKVSSPTDSGAPITILELPKGESSSACASYYRVCSFATPPVLNRCPPLLDFRCAASRRKGHLPPGGDFYEVEASIQRHKLLFPGGRRFCGDNRSPSGGKCVPLGRVFADGADSTQTMAILVTLDLDRFGHPVAAVAVLSTVTSASVPVGNP